ncbi:hypothetical protein [Nocardia camponoti]|uniref:Uncharacterized protein n=1 Tax=Nocardia camponoti TaxID=1616106 RepID=A0A917QUB7_9NOCA|nr:hypothetical protein [Nocardia camponoti]GGK69229.1 hypothetical protein GCM10011591_46700 [Nocardia camponoti]
MAIDWDQFYPPSEEKRDQKRRDLLARARTIKSKGWDDYQYVWSTGETVGVALLLNDDAVLAEMGETQRDVLSRWAYDLFGQKDGSADEAADFARTADWFANARAGLAS